MLYHTRLCQTYARSKPFPVEMAVFALDAAGGCHLRNTLLHAKLYNAKTKEPGRLMIVVVVVVVVVIIVIIIVILIDYCRGLRQGGQIRSRAPDGERR